MRCCGLLLFFLFLASGAAALEVAGVPVAAQVSANGRTLQLNGAGVRSKFFVKIYVGALYTTRRLTTAETLLADPGDKLIRMHFLYDGIAEEKIVAAFAEGLAKNAPQFAASAAAREFLALFRGSGTVHRGDVLDLSLRGDGVVDVLFAGRVIGTLRSPELARAILAMYVGDHPADEHLKRRLLGGE